MISSTKDRTDQLVTHCVYQIATGKWPEGSKLPSTRALGEAFGVDRRTVLAAQERLEISGLVERRERSGTFVRRGAPLDRLTRHDKSLNRLYDTIIDGLLPDETLSPIGVFRYLAEIARLRSLEQPTCAFVECTRTQATGHAQEVLKRTGVGCVPLVLDELDGRRSRVPAAIRTLLVSKYHEAELGGILEAPDLDILAVPIEIDPSLASSLPGGVRSSIVFEFDEVEGLNILEDVRSTGWKGRLSPRTVEEIDDALMELFGSTKEESSNWNGAALLSPRAWGRAAPAWREHPRVLHVRFEIAESAWDAITDHLGLPLGPFA